MNFRTLVPDGLAIDFVSKRKIFFAISMVLNLLAIVLFFVRPLNLGVDFTEGTVIRIQFEEPTDANAVRADLSTLALPTLTVQDFGGQGREFLLRFVTPEDAVDAVIMDQFASIHGEGVVTIRSTDTVGETVGAEFRLWGVLSFLLITLFIGFFISVRFQPAFGLGAVVALIHDVLITLGALMLVQYEFSLATLAALLTVIGFSVNDTIIVSDRVRENIKLLPKMALGDVINKSINDTLSRTLLTTGTALLVLLALYGFGGEVLKPFAFTLVVGFITGTYSSIYIAAPVVLFWSGRSSTKK